MSDDMHETPEGFTLARPLLLPDVRTFGELFTYVREWDSRTMSHYAGQVARPDLVPAPRMIGRNELGPYLSFRKVPGRRDHSGIAVVASDAVVNAIAPRIVTDDDHLSFQVIYHPGNDRALVLAEHGYILGSHWLAYIDPATIPAGAVEYRERLGTTADGGYIVVDVTIGAPDTRERETVTHETVTGLRSLSLTGDRYEKGARRDNPVSVGQIREDLADIVTPAAGWTLDEIRELGEIWGQWHGHDMHAACAHMPADARERWDRRETVTCTAGSGYTYGRGWLVELVPDDVLDRVRHLMRSRTDDLYRARGYDGAGKAYPAGGAS